MPKPFYRRAYEFFRFGFWRLRWERLNDDWQERVGFQFHIDGAEGRHFDKIGVRFWLWRRELSIYWVDAN